jgi:hypothetical protein
VGCVATGVDKGSGVGAQRAVSAYGQPRLSCPAVLPSAAVGGVAENGARLRGSGEGLE